MILAQYQLACTCVHIFIWIVIVGLYVLWQDIDDQIHKSSTMIWTLNPNKSADLCTGLSIDHVYGSPRISSKRFQPPTDTVTMASSTCLNGVNAAPNWSHSYAFISMPMRGMVWPWLSSTNSVTDWFLNSCRLCSKDVGRSEHSQAIECIWRPSIDLRTNSRIEQ